MAISNVKIANRALTLLSANRLMSFNEASEEGRKIRAVFDETRDALLAEHNWNFAIDERQLALLSDTPVMGEYLYAYQLPSDCIRFIRMVDDEECKVEGHTILTNSDDARIEYLKRETDPTKFSAGFIKALSSRIAADLAFGITQNATLATQLDAMAARDLKEAKWSDGQEGAGMTVVQGNLITARQR